MTGFSKSNSGASMLYVLAALIVTGFISGALIKMTSSDKTNTALYKTSASARVTAKSGMIAATSCLQLTKVPSTAGAAYTKFKADSTFVMGLLADWIDPSTVDANHRFIPPTTGVTPGDFIPLVSSAGANSPRYRVEVLAFDPAERNILLRSEGIGKGGSRATMTSVYNLDGLGYATYSDWTDENAIHIEDDIRLWVRAPITINGDCRFSRRVDFDEFASTSEFNGIFRSQDSDTKDTLMEFKGRFTFRKNCYFGTRPYWQRAAANVTPPNCNIQIEGKSGYPHGDTLLYGTSTAPANVTLGNTSYWLDKSYPRTSWLLTYHNFKNNIIRYNDDFDVDLKFNSTPSECPPSAITQVTTLDKSTMLDSLEINKKPCEIEVDLNAIDATKIISLGAGTYSASALESIAAGNEKWNDFTVFSTSQSIILAGATESITGKYILIIRAGGKVQPDGQAKMFSVTGADQKSAGSHFTIINEAGEINNIGGWEKFRGLLYNTGSKMHIGGSENTSPRNFYGAIYARAGSGNSIEWFPRSSVTGPGVMGTVNYDASVYKELEAAGLVSKTGIDCDNPQTEDFTRLKMVADRIHTSLVSQSL